MEGRCRLHWFTKSAWCTARIGTHIVRCACNCKSFATFSKGVRILLGHYAIVRVLELLWKTKNVRIETILRLFFFVYYKYFIKLFVFRIDIITRFQLHYCMVCVKHWPLFAKRVWTKQSNVIKKHRSNCITD